MGDNATAIGLDTAFDMGVIPEADRASFGDHKFTNVGDVVSYARDMTAKASAAATITPDSKLDMTGWDGDAIKMFNAKKIDTVGGLRDWAVNGEKLIGSFGQNPMMKPEPGKLVEYFKKHGDVFGVPKEPKDYAWDSRPQMPDGVEWDQKLEDRFRSFFHERGLPNEMFKDFADFGAQLQIDFINNARQQVDVEARETRDALRSEWGAQEARNIEVARFAARNLGLGADVIDKINSEIAAPNTIKLLHALGEKMEGASTISGNGSSLQTSKDIAQQKLNNLDQAALNDAAHANHAQVVAEQERLMAIIHA